MRFPYARLLAVALLAAVTVAGCRPGAAGGSATDSTNPRVSSPSESAASTSALARADSIVLKTDKTAYKAGETMTLTFQNRGGASYTFNPCTRTVERDSGGRWTALPEEGRMCTMQAFILAPHATQTGTTELPTPLAPGRYRVAVRMTLEQSGGKAVGPVYAVSDPISVS
jgi:hypothetical protein